VPPLNWEKIEEIAIGAATEKNAFLVGHAERRERGRRILQIFVDTDEGITIAECAGLNRDLGEAIDSLGFLNEPFEVEVSSPGIDKPLKLLRQYKKNIGRTFKVTYRNRSERTTFVGALEAVEGEHIKFLTEKKELLDLEFSDIVETIEELPW
jgi:ribosome maturation factor RimP